MQLLQHATTFFQVMVIHVSITTTTNSVSDGFSGVNNADNAVCHSDKEDISSCGGVKDPR